MIQAKRAPEPAIPRPTCTTRCGFCTSRGVVLYNSPDLYKSPGAICTTRFVLYNSPERSVQLAVRGETICTTRSERRVVFVADGPVLPESSSLWCGMGLLGGSRLIWCASTSNNRANIRAPKGTAAKQFLGMMLKIPGDRFPTSGGLLARLQAMCACRSNPPQKDRDQARRKNGIEPGSRSRRIADSAVPHHGLPSEKERYEARTDPDVEPAGRNGPSACAHLCPLRSGVRETLGVARRRR